MIGPELVITVPGDWPDRSRRFWTQMEAITGRRGITPREGR